MATMLLVTRGTHGDLIPLLGIASALKARGHTVIMLTHCAYERVIRRANLEFIALDTANDFERFLEDGPLLNTPQGLSLFFQRHLLPSALLEYRLIQSLCTDPDTVLITRHMSSVAAMLAAEKLHLPLVRVFIAPSQITTFSLLEQLCEYVLSADINRLRAVLDLPPVSNWNAWLHIPQRNIAPWPAWFATPVAGWPTWVSPVGFVIHDAAETGDLPREAQKLLNDNDPPVLITSGTGIFLGKEFYMVAAHACQQANRRALLVTRYERLVPDPLPSGIHRFLYLPFASVMPHMAAVIHHGGTSTLARAISAGIPQLALAAGGDRPDTATHLEHLGVARYVPPPLWQPDYVAATLQNLLSSMVIRQNCQELAHKVSTERPEAMASAAIEELVSLTPSIKRATGAFVETAEKSAVIVNTQSAARLEAASSVQRALARLSPERRALLAARLRGQKFA